MKKILNLGLIVTTWMMAMLFVRAETAAPATNEVTHTITLSGGLKDGDVANAAAKAFTKYKWATVSVDGNTVKASLNGRGILVTATAVCSGSEVKITADFQPGSYTVEKARATVQRWLRNIDKGTKEALGLLPTKK